MIFEHRYLKTLEFQIWYHQADLMSSSHLQQVYPHLIQVYLIQFEKDCGILFLGGHHSHVLEFHEDAYCHNILSQIVFNIEGQCGQKNKSMVKNRPQMLASISLEYSKIFVYSYRGFFNVWTSSKHHIQSYKKWNNSSIKAWIFMKC